MGFEVLGLTEAQLDFSGTEWEGLEVRCSLDLELGAVLAMRRLAAALPDDDDDAVSVEQTERIEQLFRDFGTQLIKWNAMARGELLPPDADGMMRVPMRLATVIIRTWLRALGEIPDPSHAASGNGQLSEAASIPPVASLSGSPPS